MSRLSKDKSGCHRPILSCLRCREKKVKCDKLDPCAQCKSAAVTCVWSAVSGQQRPRSITQFLQSEIERLENRLGHSLNAVEEVVAHGKSSSICQFALSPSKQSLQASPSTPSPSDTPRHRPAKWDQEQNMMRLRIRACPSIQQIVSSTSPTNRSVLDISRLRMSLTPSQVLAPSMRKAEGSRMVVKLPKLTSVLDIRKLASIPAVHVHSLVRAYLQQVHPIHPFVHAATLLRQVDRVLEIVHREESSEIIADYDFLVVYVVLAISVSLGSATSGHGPRRMVFSEGLFREGIQHLSGENIFKSEIAELQATLLMLHYGTINPRCVNVWMLGGAAMRHCLKLGLHRELPELVSIDPLAMDLRRRVFWMAYCLDRQICAALQYPISLSDVAINIHHFSILDDSGITLEGVAKDAPTTKEPAFHWLAYRRLHSNMVEVHFHGKPLPDGLTWDQWIAEMEMNFRNWYTQHQADYPWTETAYHNSLTYLHRPSPRTPSPSPRSLLMAFENASRVAMSYKDDLHAGYFRRPWLAAHHTFESSAIVLFCLRHGAAAIATKFDADEVYRMTKLFTSNLQSISSHSWPEVSQCADIYERLLTPLIQAILLGSDPKDFFSAEQDRELARLLYPGTSCLETIGPDTLASMNNMTDIFQSMETLDWDFSQLIDIPLDEDMFKSWTGSIEMI